MPLIVTTCGLVGSGSTMVTVALREFRAVGLNLTVMLQLAPPASVAPHALVNRKSPGFVPPKVMVIGSAALPRLLKVIVREPGAAVSERIVSTLGVPPPVAGLKRISPTVA